MSIKECIPHYSRWVEKYYAEKLRKQGFICYNNENLSWYKIVNKEVLLSVYFVYSFPYDPILAELGYGIHPLFIPVEVPHKLSVRGYGRDDMLLTSVHLPGPRRLFEGQYYVQYSDTPEGGAEKLDEIIFPTFSKIHSLEDAYKHHREYYIGKLNRYKEDCPGKPFNGPIAGVDFMDEAIYFDDKETIALFSWELDQIYFDAKRNKRVELQRQAIYNGKRDEFLADLEKRKRRFTRTLEKKLNINV